MAKIGYYGGTFNPIHNGHMGVCRQAMNQLHLDRLLLIPTYVPPHKAAPDLADGHDRLEMCRLAAEGMPGVQADGYEIMRGGVSYSIDTLRYLRGQYPGDDLYLLMGTDNFLIFEHWKNWQDIGKLATLAVASREPDDKPSLYMHAQRLAIYGIRTVFLNNPVRVISSSEIRAHLAAGERSDMVPAAVMRFILENNLYREKENGK